MKKVSDRIIRMMRIALGLSWLPCSDAEAETVLLVSHELDRLGGKFSLRDVSRIQEHIQFKYKQRKVVKSKKD